jgi:hypothetical protein
MRRHLVYRGAASLRAQPESSPREDRSRCCLSPISQTRNQKLTIAESQAPNSGLEFTEKRLEFTVFCEPRIQIPKP